MRRNLPNPGLIKKLIPVPVLGGNTFSFGYYDLWALSVTNLTLDDLFAIHGGNKKGGLGLDQDRIH